MYKQTSGAPHGWAQMSDIPGYGCSPVIAAPNPTNPEKLYVLIHEVGHIIFEHHKTGWFHGCGNKKADIDSTLEYEAETFALDEMRKHDIPLPFDVVNGAHLYVASHVACDEAHGHRVSSRAVGFAQRGVLEFTGGHYRVPRRDPGGNGVQALELMTEGKIALTFAGINTASCVRRGKK